MLQEFMLSQLTSENFRTMIRQKAVEILVRDERAKHEAFARIGITQEEPTVDEVMFALAIFVACKLQEAT